MSGFPKLIYRLTQSQSKSQQVILGISTNWYEVYMERQKIQINWFNIDGKKAGELTPANFKTYYKATLSKTVWSLCKSRQIDHWNRIESPEIDLHKYSPVIFGKGAREVQRSKDSLFNKWCWNNWIFTCKKKKESRHRLYTLYKY